MKSLAVICALVAIQLANSAAGDEPSAKTLLRTMPVVKNTYTKVQWTAIAKSLKPKSDNPKAKPIKQSPNAGKVNKAINGQIVGGSAATLGQFPWQVVIHIDSSSLCGGSLILNDWVLTAAHCALGRNNFKVHYGIIDWTTAPSTQIKDTIVKYVHESYNTNNLNNDIALLKLPSPVTLSDNVATIKLPPLSDGSTTFENTLATVSGFGKTSDAGNASPTMNWVQVTVISNELCASTYGTSTIISSTICTLQTSKSTCQGDSGGPLVYKDSSNTWVQIGVVSFGHGGGCLVGPSGFARTASFLGWMSTKIGQDVSGSTTSAAETTQNTGTTTTGPTTTAAPTTTKPGTTTTPGSTKKTTTAKCATNDFSTMYKCCQEERNPLVVINSKTGKCANKNGKVINNFYFNKLQNVKNDNKLEMHDAKITKNYAKDACFANCFLNEKDLLVEGQIHGSALHTFLTEANQENNWNGYITDALFSCLDYVQKNPVPSFVNGKMNCSGTPLALLQCTQMKSYDGCTRKMNPKTDKTCISKWATFDACKNTAFPDEVVVEG